MHFRPLFSPCGMDAAQPIGVEIFRWKWTWADETHLPAEDINELGQLVQTVTTHKTTQRSHSRVVANLKQMSVGLVMWQERFAIRPLNIHGAEFPEHEIPPALAHARALIKNRPL